jgi:hypothetical protein
MIKLYHGKKVTLCNKNVCMTVYGKEAELLSSLAALTFICMAVAALIRAVK